MVNTVEQRLLNTEQAAEVLGIKASTLPVWRHRGDPAIPFCRIGRSVRYKLVDLHDYIESRRVDRTGNES